MGTTDAEILRTLSIIIFSLVAAVIEVPLHLSYQYFVRTNLVD